jgi:SAM-dependent methyltransferase
MPALYTQVRKELFKVSRQPGRTPNLLDVGGRKSHYTIGLPVNVHITDLPRQSEIQHALKLGATLEVVGEVKGRRSNVRWMLFDDMTQSSLDSEVFDCIVSVEVLEHVEKDRDFIREVHRILKTGGVFVMTTPNGDFVRKPSRDHKRHYTRQQLLELLSSEFVEVRVDYAIKTGIFRRLGLKSWSMKKPVQTFLSMFGNLVSTFQSASGLLRGQAAGTHNLVAFARKAG